MRLDIGKLVPALAFAVMLAIGLLVFRDYGISADEHSDRYIGAVSAKYVLSFVDPAAFYDDLQDVQDIRDAADRDYGVGFQFPAIVLEGFLGMQDGQKLYFFRHFLTFAVALVGFMATYRIAARRHASWKMGLLAVALLFLSPRFFAESFYNDKDIVFAAALALSALTMFTLFERPGFKLAIVHALATAYALDIRIMAILTVAGTVVLLAIRVIQDRSQWRRIALILVSYLSLTAIFHVATFPFLWADPINNFLFVLKNMSHFRTESDNLYLGEIVNGAHLPWHYVPVWIGITTPPMILGLFAVGSVVVMWKLSVQHWRFFQDDKTVQDLMVLGLCLAPIVTVIVLHSVLYNGWRHMYFVYPFLILTAVNGANAIWERCKTNNYASAAATWAVTSYFAVTVIWIVLNHPFQFAYFNIFAGKNVGRNFDMDYWGLSNRKGVESVLARDDAPLITISGYGDDPLDQVWRILDDNQNKRIQYVKKLADAKYVFYNFFLERTFGNADSLRSLDLFSRVQVDGRDILQVYKRKPSDLALRGGETR